MADEQQAMAEPPAEVTPPSQAMQQTLLENATRFADEVTERAQHWLFRWPEPAAVPKAAAIIATLREEAERLRNECRRPEGPQPLVMGGALGALRGADGAPGPLARLQALIKSASAGSLEDQRLLSDLDALTVRLEGLRAQWQEYASLSAPRQSTSAQPITEPLPPLAPLPSNPWMRLADQDAAFQALLEALEAENAGAAAGQGESLRHGLAGTLKVMLGLLAAVLLVAALAYEAVVHLPLTEARPTPNPTLAPSASNAPTATQAAATSTPPAEATTTATPQPTTSPTAQPTATSPPSPGTTQLSVNPPTLTIPCPGTGAASLQLLNTGSQPLAWQASVSGAPGEVLLDGATSEQGHLNPGDEATISVTAETQGVHGAITITYSGAPAPISVGYSVGC